MSLHYLGIHNLYSPQITDYASYNFSWVYWEQLPNLKVLTEKKTRKKFKFYLLFVLFCIHSWCPGHIGFMNKDTRSGLLMAVVWFSSRLRNYLNSSNYIVFSQFGYIAGIWAIYHTRIYWPPDSSQLSIRRLLCISRFYLLSIPETICYDICWPRLESMFWTLGSVKRRTLSWRRLTTECGIGRQFSLWDLPF